MATLSARKECTWPRGASSVQPDRLVVLEALSPRKLALLQGAATRNTPSMTCKRKTLKDMHNTAGLQPSSTPSLRNRAQEEMADLQYVWCVCASQLPASSQSLPSSDICRIHRFARARVCRVQARWKRGCQRKIGPDPGGSSPPRIHPASRREGQACFL